MKLDQTILDIEESVALLFTRVMNNHERLDRLFESFSAELALTIIEEDQFINNLEIEINDKCIYALALMQPVAKDLRFIITAIKIASELERIGDYAKNIAASCIKTDKEIVLNPKINKAFKEMHQSVETMLSNAFVAYQTRNSKDAFTIGKEDRMIDRMVSDFFTKLNEEYQLTFEDSLYVFKVIRNMERSGDHIINICEQVIYLDKGQHYEFG